jgi:hypothetical protein
VIHSAVAIIFANVKTTAHLEPAAVGTNMAKIIFAVIGILVVLAVLVATGRIRQKGPHGPGGWFEPPE